MPLVSEMSQPQTTVECTIPVLPVRQLSASLRFYTETLGFQLDWGGQAGSLIASVSRDGRPIMLSQLQSWVAPAWVWIGLEDDSLFEEYRARSVRVLQEPRNNPWAFEMKLLDPDDNVLWLGTEPKPGLPFFSEENC